MILTTVRPPCCANSGACGVLITEISPFSVVRDGGMSEGCYYRLGGIFFLLSPSRWVGIGLIEKAHDQNGVCVHKEL